MIAELIAALAVAAAPASTTTAPQRDQVRANAPEAKPAAQANVTARERARLAKAQNKDTKCSTKQKPEAQKKAAAT